MLKKKQLAKTILLSTMCVLYTLPSWAANSGGTADQPVSGDYSGLVVTDTTSDANNTNVEIDTAGVQNVYGGHITNTGSTKNTNDNTVTVSATIEGPSGTIQGGVYGGYNKGKGTANNNTVHINAGANVNNLYGGYTEGLEANGNKIYITGGEVLGAVAGGRSRGGVANNNEVHIYATTGTVTINSKTNSHINGGNNGWATANDNSVTIGSDADQYDIVMENQTAIGGQGIHASGNKVTIGSEAGTKKITIKDTYGVWLAGTNGLAENNMVIIQNSNTNVLNDIHGSYTMSIGGTAKNNTVLIKDGVFGKIGGSPIISGAYGESQAGNLENNSVIITGGTFVESADISGGINLSVFGRSGDGHVTGNKVHISGVTLAPNAKGGGGVYGGYAMGAGQVSGNEVLVEQKDGKATKITTNIIGGVNLKGSNGTHKGDITGNKVTILGGEVGGEVFGGLAAGGLGNVSDNQVVIDKTTSATPTVTSKIYGGMIDAIDNDKDITGNKVTINAGTISEQVYGAKTIGTGKATGNSIVISGGTMSADIFAAYTAKGDVTDNSVDIRASADGSLPTFNGVTIYGGYSEDSNANISNNTLNMHTIGITAKDVINFDTYNFFLPENIAADDTVLSLTGNNQLDLSDSTVNLGVVGSAPTLQLNDEITLIHNENNTIVETGAVYGKLQQGVSLEYEFETVLKNNDHDLVTKVTAIPKGTTEQAKSPVETRSAAIGFINSGSDLLTDKGILNATRVTAVAKNNTQIFGSANAGNMRYKSGSHTDVKGYNIVLGIAKAIDNKTGVLTYGPFIESGWGSYSTYLDSGIRGDGNTNYYGAGIFARQDNLNGVYYEGSARGGYSSSSYNSGDMLGAGGQKVSANYDTGSIYYGLHLGIGKITKTSETSNVDLYAKLLYTHQNGDSVTLGGQGNGEIYDFKAIDSIRTRLGARFNKNYNKKFSGYIGTAVEYEFNGTAKATVKGFSTPEPSVKGLSGMLEIGCIFEAQRASDPVIDIGIQGWGGKRQGLSANANFIWKF